MGRDGRTRLARPNWETIIFPVQLTTSRIGNLTRLIHTLLHITGDWETMAVKAEVWVEAVTKGGRRFMAAWRQEEEDAARHRQEKREATRLGKLQSHTEA